MKPVDPRLLPKDEEELKTMMVKACKMLYLKGAVDMWEGHISARLPGSERILIIGHVHHSGIGLEDVKPEHIIVIDRNGRVIEGRWDPPGEWRIHTAVYKARPEVNSVMHMHSPYSIALGVAGVELKPIDKKAAIFADGVPILPYPYSWVEDEEQERRYVETLGQRRAILLQNHGSATVGETLIDALFCSIFLERSAQIQLSAMLLNPSGIKPMPTDAAKSYIANLNESLPELLWLYLENKLKEK